MKRRRGSGTWGRTLALATALSVPACAERVLDFFPPDADSSPDEPAELGRGGAPAEETPSGGAPVQPPGPAGSSGAGGADPAPRIRVLLVVDEVATNTDDVIEARLEAAGRVVTRIVELDLLPSDAVGFDLVVVSPSADRVDLGSTLVDVSVPLLLLEPTVAATHGLGATAFVTDDTVVLASPAHPIVEGLPSPQLVCSSAVTLNGNTILPGAAPLAVAEADEAVGVLLAFDAGATVGANVLAERRVIFGLLKTGACRTPDSWELFERSIAWLLSD